MDDLKRLSNRQCNTPGCPFVGVLKSPVGMQTCYASGGAMGADQRCPACLDNLGTFMFAVWRAVRDKQGGTDPKPETHEMYRRIGKAVLVMSVRDLRVMGKYGGILAALGL